MPVPVSELQKVAPSAVIELFQLELNVKQHGVSTVYRFHSGTSLNSNGDVVWAGNAYLRWPVEADGFAYEAKGSLPRPRIRVSNILGTITAILLSLPNGLEGAKVTRIRTLARYLDAVNFPGNVNPYGTPDPTAELPQEIFYIDRKAAESRDLVEYELAAAFDLGNVRAPKRQCVANICQFEYRSAECGYTGNKYFNDSDQKVSTLAEDVCGKRLSSCRLRFLALRGAGSVTLGSNVLTLDQTPAFNLVAGDPITGFAVPAGTTVSNASGATVTMSANATATSSITKTGTLQGNLTQIVLANTTGLAVGMLISGPKIIAGTTISAISGNTITLQQAVDPWSVAGSVTTRQTSLYSGTNSSEGMYSVGSSNRTEVLSSITGIAVGQYVIGPTIPQSANAKVTSVVNTFSGDPYVVFSYSGRISGSTGTYTFYMIPSQSAATYTFTAPSKIYTFREESPLNFGSFPGIGTYYT